MTAPGADADQMEIERRFQRRVAAPRKALVIACGKAFLVAGFFMHLISERKMIYGLLIFTACFFLGLMFLILSAYADFPRMTVTH